jgi:predicted  nucleic acid-binding Zn-ribbon protein
MPATADNLRELHQLHQRAKALRDRLTSGPKTLAARQTALANRQSNLEAARKALQDSKVQLKKNEHLLLGHQGKIDDLKVKLNQVKKNDEYKAIQNQIAHDKLALGRVEDEILNAYSEIDAQTAALAALEAEVKKFAEEMTSLQNQIESQAAAQKAQLEELETAIVEAESIIPEELRERYRRTVKQHGADAMAAADVDSKTKIGSCTGCFVAVTPQMVNELINADSLTFCKSCGRVLYLAEEDHPNTRRSGG